MASNIIPFPLTPANDDGRDPPPSGPIVLARGQRQEIQRAIDLLIAVLDAADGDCDLEDDDPAGGAVEDCGEVEDWRPDGIKLLKPVYGIDQSLGPINEEEVYADYKRRLVA